LNYIKEILYLVGNDRRQLPWLMCLFVLSSILDLIGLGLIVPFTMVITSASDISAEIPEYIFSIFNLQKSNQTVVYLLSFSLALIFLVKSLFAIFINKVVIKFSLNMQVRLKSELLYKYQFMPYVRYAERNSSEYITTMVKMVPQFTMQVLLSLLKILTESIAFIVIVAFLAYKNGIVLAILLTYLLSVAFAYDMFFRKLVKHYGAKANYHDILMVKGLKEAVDGIKETRVLSCEKYFNDYVSENAIKYSYYSMRNQLIRLAPNYLIEFLLLLFIVLYVSFTMYYHTTLNTVIPTLSVFAFAAIRLKPSVNIILNGLSLMRSGRNSTSRIFNDFHSIDITHDLKTLDNKVENNKNTFKELILENVNFKYNRSNVFALNDINFTIHSGESIGIVGTSGSGKTTLIDVMLGLIKPDAGRIMFNGLSLDNEENKQYWRSSVAYIPQQVLLIDASLKQNIALGQSEVEIDDEKVQDAINQAYLSEFVNELPQKLETIIGENGIRISGGQRQRVALARAFYHQRSVLIMDEATSALDNETESVIVNEIKKLKGQITLIVVAHRLSTVKHCDKIFRIERGRIVKEGNYDYVIGGE